MKRNISIFTLFLLFFGSFSLLGMEESKKRPVFNIPALLGYSQKELKNNKNKQNEYLKKVHLLASLSHVQEFLRKQVGVINDTTTMMQDSLKDSFYRIGFEYIDRPCRVKQILCGSQVFFEDGDRESTIFLDTFVLTTADAKAAYLQAKNLLKIKSLVLSNILKVDKRGLDTLEHTHNKLMPFTKTLLSSDNEELVALGKWLKHTQAFEQQSKQIVSMNSLLSEVVLHHYPSFLEDRNMNQAAKVFGKTIEQVIDSVAAFVHDYFPALKGLLSVSKDCIEFIESYETSDELPNFERYNKFRSIFSETYALANSNLEQNKAIYAALKKELDSYLLDRTNKNRLELLKKYSRPSYPKEFSDAVFPETLIKDNHAQAKSDDSKGDEWTANAVKDSDLKKKKTVQLAQQSNQRKKAAAQKRAQQKKASHVQVTKKGEKETNVEKELPLNNSSNQQNRAQQLPTVVYDWRVLRWYDPAFLSERNPDKRSLLYHTLPFVVNQINKQYGVQVKQANRTHPNKTDIVYYTGGEIHYKKGERAGQKETVLFALCEDDAGIAYHVGWNAKEDSLFKEFEANEFNYQFPTLYNEHTFEKKTIVVDVNDEQFKTTYRENQFCFEIDDQRNGVTVILYKPAYA